MTRANIKTADAYVKLNQKKKELEDKVKAIKVQIAAMEEGMIKYFQDHGLQSLNSSGSTVYLQRQLFASLTDKEAAHAKLREHGHGELVNDNVNSQQLSAWIRELIADHDKKNPDEISTEDLNKKLDLPKDLQDLIRVTEKFSVRVRKATK